MTDRDYSYMSKRRRGTVSLPCPVCGGPTRVRLTRRNEDGKVVRVRVCRRAPRAHGRITSVEDWE